MKFVLIKQKFVPENQAQISIKDRGFRFGDGVFETIRVHQGQLLDFDLHLERLQYGLEQLNIPYPVAGLEILAKELVTKNKQQEGICRIIITRGEGSMGYLPSPDIVPNLIMETANLPSNMATKITAKISSYQKISTKSLPVAAKLMQGLNSTLALLEAREAGHAKAILLNELGQICETDSANIFFIKGSKLFTPKLSCGLSKGVMRTKIMQHFTVQETELTVAELKNYDLCFICNIALRTQLITAISGQNNQTLWQDSQSKVALETYQNVKKYLHI